MRRISWIKGAQKSFTRFPLPVRRRMVRALRISAAGQKADIAKPLQGLGAGVFEISLASRGDAYRAVYAVRIDDDIWVVDAFQKKSKQGAKTPKRDVERIRSRLSWLREQLK